MTIKRLLSTALEVIGASIFLFGVSRFSLSATILLTGVIITIFGVALEKDAQ